MEIVHAVVRSASVNVHSGRISERSSQDQSFSLYGTLQTSRITVTGL